MLWPFKVLGFFKTNWKKVLLGVAGIIVLSWTIGFVKGVANIIRDNATLECNDDKLKDQITTLEKLLADEKLSAQRLADELTEMQAENESRKVIIKSLSDVLKDVSLDDGDISPRTKEFLIQLNERSKEVQ